MLGCTLKKEMKVTSTQSLKRIRTLMAFAVVKPMFISFGVTPLCKDLQFTQRPCSRTYIRQQISKTPAHRLQQTRTKEECTPWTRLSAGDYAGPQELAYTSHSLHVNRVDVTHAHAGHGHTAPCTTGAQHPPDTQRALCSAGRYCNARHISAP